jgi:hypothetical protein
MPESRQELLLHQADGRLAKRFRRHFHVPFEVFVDLTTLAKERWWPQWTESSICRAGKQISNLELKILGALFVLACDVTHFVCSTSTYISEEVHRSFFLDWTAKMSTIKKEFIYMPQDEATFQFVVGEYTKRGLPGCVGSVDCVHIGWNRCPTQYYNMYTGKECFLSVAYEVICTARKFIQSVSVGHPGSRNNKHIVKTDETVLDLLEGNG